MRLLEYIWGDNIGAIWNQPLELEDVNVLVVEVYPNPTANKIYLNGLLNETVVDVFSLDGRQLSTNLVEDNYALELNVTSGIYLLKITSEGKSIIKKIIVK